MPLDKREPLTLDHQNKEVSRPVLPPASATEEGKARRLTDQLAYRAATVTRLKKYVSDRLTKRDLS
jgi:hypothetical protein